MCRFLVYAGLQRPILMADLVTNPPHSIILQSYASREREESPLNGDGFGLGWYTLPTADGELDREPCVFTSVTPAWNNMNLFRLAQKIRSQLIFGHVRAASPGTMTSEANCHPFAHQRFMWMHNGVVSSFSLIKRRLINRLSDYTFSLLQGTTDSEHCFVLYLQCFFELRNKASGRTDSYALDDGEEADPEMLRDAMLNVIQLINQWLEEAEVSERSLMNFAVTDGQTVIVTRYTNLEGAKAASLYYSSGSEFQALDDGRYRMVQHGKRQHCHILASEPLTENRHEWIPVPTNHLVLITPKSNLLLYPIPFTSKPPSTALIA